MTSRGRVRQYSTKEGWGVIDSADTLGGCLVQVLSVYTPSGTLSAGDEVDFEWEPLPPGVDEKLFRSSANFVRPAGSVFEPPPVNDDRPKFMGGSWTWNI